MQKYIAKDREKDIFGNNNSGRRTSIPFRANLFAKKNYIFLVHL